MVKRYGFMNVMLYLFTLFIIASMLAGCGNGANLGSTEKIIVTSAKKTGSYLNMKPIESSQAMLVIDIEGITEEEFKDISAYMMIDGNRYSFESKQYGIIQGSQKLRLIGVVRTDVTNGVLHMGSYPPVYFKIDEKVYDRID